MTLGTTIGEWILLHVGSSELHLRASTINAVSENPISKTKAIVRADGQDYKVEEGAGEVLAMVESRITGVRQLLS